MNRSQQRGFTLLGTAVCAIAILGLVGLAVDLGRMYIAKSEAQTYVDSASLAATMELDGTWDGITRARSQVAANVNRWNFNTTAFSGSQIYFAQDLTGSWEENPVTPNGYRFVRVVADVSVPLSFVPVVTKSGGGAPVSFLIAGPTASVRGDSTGGQEPKTSFREGLFPFSPLAHNSTPPHFGLIPGQQYTLRWGANPRLNVNTCAGDNEQAMIDLAKDGGGDERGYIEETGAAVIRATIEQDYQTIFRTIGDTVNMTGGAKQTELNALINRVHQDTDSASETYAEYVAAGTGNGRRLVGALINTGYPEYRVVQIGAFFLLPEGEYNAGGNSPFCAEYVGAWLQGGKHKGVADSGGQIARLVK